MAGLLQAVPGGSLNVDESIFPWGMITVNGIFEDDKNPNREVFSCKVLLRMNFHYNGKPSPQSGKCCLVGHMKRMMFSSPMLWGVARRLRFVATLLLLLWLAVWAVLPSDGV